MKKIITLLSLVIVAACSSSTGVKSINDECFCDQKYVRSNLEFLASDELEGRETGERGNDLASLFIASELKKYSVKPFGDSGTYFQNIEFLSKRFLESSYFSVCNKEGNDLFELKIGNDFFTQTSSNSEKDSVHVSGQIVFAGYGITADEYNYDDYEDIDIKNKIVVILWGEPYSIDDNFFDGEKPTKYYNPQTKAEIAKEKGAAGFLILPGAEVLQYWSLLKDMVLQSNMYMKEPDTSSVIPPRMVGAIISEESAKKLFAGEEMEFDKIQQMLEEKEIPRAFELNKNIDCHIQMRQEEVTSCNVVGIIEGIDPVLKNEYIAIGAHYDHVGVTNGKVFNGADDNASGTTSILEVARQLSQFKSNKRSIIVLLYTGEEKGLYGSAFYIEKFAGINSVKANINLDMVGRGSLDTMFVIGTDHSVKEFDETIQKINLESAGFVFDYSLSNSNFYYQSDHYNFSKFGIPVVFFFDNMSVDLHQPTDDIEKINFEKICKTVGLVKNLTLEFANTKMKFGNIDKAE
ncbi:MAG: M28 family peptidase [bacterium]